MVRYRVVRKQVGRVQDFVLLALLLVDFVRGAEAAMLEVPTSYPTIQSALDAAQPGDTIVVRAGVYFEKLRVTQGGSPGSFVTLQAHPGETVVLDGTGVPGANMIAIESKSWVRIQGFEIRNNLNVRDGSGIRITGSGSHIEIRQNRIHDMRGRNAMGITVYGTQAQPLSDLVIDGNEIFDCEPAPSEALVLNGNVTNFSVTNNFVHDVNNIGIDLIGGERDIQPDPAKVARLGVVRGNRVLRARSIYGDGFAAGIYVDGGQDITIENNFVAQCDLGIEVGAENAGIVARNITVRSNVLMRNDKAGLAFGGYAPQVGRVENCLFENNTLYQNEQLWSGFGEIWIQWATNNVVRNNLVVAGRQNLLLTTSPGATANTIDFNLWFGPSSAGQSGWVWQGNEVIGFAAYRAASGQDGHSVFADPLLWAPQQGDMHLDAASPAVDGGDPATSVAFGSVDLDGAPRQMGARVDIGADEFTCGNGTLEPGESCDDGNLVDCDGCDRNCTASSVCGNRVVCAPEQCDDGNTSGGDCCSATCTFEPAGSPCSDGVLCTAPDQCDGGGVCTGAAVPLTTGCHQLVRSGTSRLRIVDLANDRRDLVEWTWRAGTPVALAEFGDPRISTDYELCVFSHTAGMPSLALSLPVRAGEVCSGRPCWSAGSTGFVYRSRWGNPFGVVTLSLYTSSAGKAGLRFRARGPKIPLPSLPLQQDPSVVVELRNSAGSCWQATMSAPALRSDVSRFTDVND
jgi:cysteine-rich repeat protein